MIHKHEFEPWSPGCCCSFERCTVCGLVHKTGWCANHQKQRWFDCGEEYWTKHNKEWHRDGIPHNRSNMNEFRDALKGLNITLSPRTSVLEIGCGVGHLIPFFLALNMNYHGIEPSPWAVKYIHEAYGNPFAKEGFWPSAYAYTGGKPHTVLSVHSLEHMDDADAAVQAMTDAAYCHVLICVPDGGDYWNPDHIWFFREFSLETMMEESGLRNVHRYVHERPGEAEDFVWYAGLKM